MKKKSLGFKIFTLIYCIVLVSLMGGFTGYLVLGQDFKEPETSNNEENPLVWEATVDEIIDYLDGLGYLKKDDYAKMSTIGTVNRIYNGIDFIWWDVDNLIEGTEEYNYWHEYIENGYIMFGGSVYSLIKNGPFAIYATVKFPGNTDDLYRDFLLFPIS